MSNHLGPSRFRVVVTPGPIGGFVRWELTNTIPGDITGLSFGPKWVALKTKAFATRLPVVGFITAIALSDSFHLAAAQSGSLAGRVTDSAGTPIARAEVSIQSSALRTTTSDSGRFRLVVPAGAHRVSVRRVGYTAVFDSVFVDSGSVTNRDFLVGTRLTVLDTVLVHKPLSAHMHAFEDRRKRRQGAFFTSEELRTMDERPIRSLLSKRLPGVTFVSYRGGTYLMSSRGSGSIDRRMRVRAILSDPRSPTGCWVQVYLDGNNMYTPHSDAVNLNEFQTRDLEAVEFYSAAMTPPEFATSWAGCGTLVLWTRLP